MPILCPVFLPRRREPREIFNTLSVNRYIAPCLWSHYKIFVTREEWRDPKWTEENLDATDTDKYFANNWRKLSFLTVNIPFIQMFDISRERLLWFRKNFYNIFLLHNYSTNSLLLKTRTWVFIVYSVIII